MMEPIAQQYAISVQDEVKVWWHTDPERKTLEPVEIKAAAPIKSRKFEWSPQGTFLITQDEMVNNTYEITTKRDLFSMEALICAN